MSVATSVGDRVRSSMRASVERELGAIFARHSATTKAYGAEFAHLWELAARHAQDGKLVRPMLLLETFDALRRSREILPGSGVAEQSELHGDQDIENVARVAAAIETLHYSFLLHDDVIDGDLVRRGRPNLIGELAETTLSPGRGRGARHWAETGGILAGNLLLSAAHQQFARLDVPAEVRVRLLDLLEHTIIETTAGEFIDVGLCDGIIAPDLNTVLTMTRRKTATYTFELPLRAAVILAGGSRQLEETLSSAGAHLGLAYQLQDDLLSTFGDAELHGKDPYSDLREGKQTAVVCFARMTSAWPSIEADFGNPELPEETAELMRTLLTECGAERFVEGLIEEQLTAFYEVLVGGSDAEEIPTELRAVLLNLVARIEGRQS